MNRMNHLKYKIEEEFDLINLFVHYCSVRFIVERIPLESRKKNNFDFNFQSWKTKKAQKQLSPMKVISTAKDPANYEGRQLEKHEQIPIDIMLQDQLTRSIMVSSNAKDQIVLKKQAEKRKMLEKQLSENTIKMNKIKKI